MFKPFYYRLTNLIRYIKDAEYIWKWKFLKGECPSCGVSIFLSVEPHPFKTRCIKCKATVTSLSLIPIINTHFSNDDISCLELSTYGTTLKYLRNRFDNVIASEYMPEYAFGETINGIANQDIQQLTYENNSLDLITSNLVFEHVPDDRKGYMESHRVLKKGGCLIFTIPLYDHPKTIQTAKFINNELHFIGEPEYHDSRIRGANSEPVFWRHSKFDICDRVKKCGFEQVILENIMIIDIQQSPTQVLYAIK